MVAYNSVAGCFDLATDLSKKSLVSKKDIKILCSLSSKDRAGDYFTHSSYFRHLLNTDHAKDEPGWEQ
jgi:hypothetical protein